MRKDRTDALLLEVIALSIRAGEAIMKVYTRSDLGATLKEDHSPLTDADRVSHHTLVSGLQALLPHLPVISEEASVVGYEERKGWNAYGLVDPLDGTKEFIKRSDEFTVNIAFIEKGMPVLGVVHAPALGWTYYAAQSRGAFKQMRGEKPSRMNIRNQPNETLKIVASRLHASEALNNLLKKMGPYELLHRGSSLKFCLVAEGSADLYPRLGPTMEWDTAAGHCIILESGGGVMDVYGNPLKYNKSDLKNPDFIAYGERRRAEPLLKYIRGSGEKI